MQDEIMLAKSCLLEKSDDSMNSSMNSVIRLLDQTYQRLLCDENNKTNNDNNNDDVVFDNDKSSKVTQNNNLSRSSSKDEDLVTVYKEQQPPKLNINNIVNGEQTNASKSQPANVTKIVNGAILPYSNLQNVTINDDIGTSLQNEVSSASSSSILSSSLSSSRTSSKHVSNKKVEFIFDSPIF